MSIDDRGIRSVKEIAISELMNQIDVIDGDLLAGYRLDEEGDCCDPILLIDKDPYSSYDDELFIHNGSDYIWDVDCHTLKSVYRNMMMQRVNESYENFLLAISYFFRKRSYIDFNKQ